MTVRNSHDVISLLSSRDAATDEDNMYSAYVLTKESRESLLRCIRPVHSKTLAHHITVSFPSAITPPNNPEIYAYAHGCNGRVEAVRVRVNGRYCREDGKAYHVTISVNGDVKAKPVESNDINGDDFEVLEPMIRLYATPQILK